MRRGDTKEAKATQVPLAQAILEQLRAYPRNLDGKLFKSSADALSACFGDLGDDLNVDDLRFHDLRTALTNMRRAGLDIMTMKQISGHRTLKMLERYNSCSEDDLRAAMERVEQRTRTTS